MFKKIISAALFLFISTLSDTVRAQNSAKLMVQRYSPIPLKKLKISPDKKFIGVIRGDSYGKNYVYEIIHAQDGRLVNFGSIPELNLLGFGVDFSDDLSTLVYCSYEANATVIDPFSGKVLSILKNKDNNFCTSIHSANNGKVVAMVYRKNIEIYDKVQNALYQLRAQITQKEFDSWKSAAAMSGNGKFLAISSIKGQMAVYDLEDRKFLFSRGSGGFIFSGHQGDLTSILFIPVPACWSAMAKIDSLSGTVKDKSWLKAASPLPSFIFSSRKKAINSCFSWLTAPSPCGRPLP
jgi:WD40 repeat protein